MDSIYDSLLQGIKSHIGLDNQNDFIVYLQSLKDFVRKLRRSYQTHLVQIDYSDFDIQAAYLITYFPQYVEMTLYILRQINQVVASETFGQQSAIQGCFFGSGPFPESIGLGIYLSENRYDCHSLQLMSCDIRANLWEPSRKMSIEQVLPGFFNGQISVQAKDYNMLNNDSLHLIRDYLSNCNLVVFQNCLNELDGNLDIFISNMDYILSEMPSNSLLILADLGQYPSVRELMQKVRDNISQLEKIEIIEDNEQRFRSTIKIPDLISQNLLTGENGLMPRKNIYTRYLIARVKSP